MNYKLENEEMKDLRNHLKIDGISFTIYHFLSEESLKSSRKTSESLLIQFHLESKEARAGHSGSRL